LIEAKLSADNALDFYTVLVTFFDSLPLDVSKSPSKEAIYSLMRTCYQHISHFNPVQRFQIITWHLQTNIAHQLHTTDDPYLFNRCCQFITHEFNENYLVKKYDIENTDPIPTAEDASLPSADPIPTAEDASLVTTSSASTVDDPFFFSNETKRSRLEAILFCLQICYQVYLRSGWTKQPIESLYLHITQRRLLLPSDDLRERLDDLSTQFTQKQRKKLSGTGGMIQTIRTYNSTAHPLRTKKIGILR
jgi:hypothetical protein